MARIVADRFREKSDQPGIIEYRAGAAGNIGAEAVAKFAPDGYTLLISPPGPLVINKLLYARLAYDSDTFVPVSVLVRNANVLIVNLKVPAENFQQLIAYAKAVAKRLNEQTFEPVGSTPAEMARFMKRESERWGRVVRARA